MTYQIMTMVGDYQVEAQPSWGFVLQDLTTAIIMARLQHEAMLEQWGRHGAYHTMVTVGDDSPEAVWMVYQGTEYTDADAEMMSLALETE